MEIGFPTVSSDDLPTFTQAVRLFALKAALGHATLTGAYSTEDDLIASADSIESYILNGKESSK